MFMQIISKQTIGRINGAVILSKRMIAKLRDAMKIPIGYEDETGFHVGIKLVLQKNESTSPSAIAKLRRDKTEKENRPPSP